MNEVSKILKNDDSEKWYSLEEIAELCGLGRSSLEHLLPEVCNRLQTSNAVKFGGYHNTKKFYSEEVLRAVKEYQIRTSAPNALENKEVALKGNISHIESERLITTRELAEQLNTSPKVVIENARKCLPNKIFENGKTTYWNEVEVTLLLDSLKSNQKTNSSDLYLESKGSISTTLTPALKIKKAFDLMQEGYEEELAILRAKNEEQRQQLEVQKPKVEFYDTVTKSESTFDMAEVAKLLKIPNMGSVKLFDFLRSKDVLSDVKTNWNEPYQNYVNAGYFKIVETKNEDRYGNIHVNKKTVVFQKGVDFIRKLAKDNGIIPKNSVALF